MGLTGPISLEEFARLSNGMHPETEAQLIRHIDRAGYTKSDGTVVEPVDHRAGWDATFSAPKSVSLTGLVGGDSRVLEVHNRAVDVSLAHLEKYVQARTGSDQSETTGKMVAAKFQHHTARPVDGYSAPQLHTHVVIFNMTQREDGKFNALQPKALFESQQYATSIYQAELTYGLRQLGYELTTGKSGAPEIAGYTKEYLKASSPRRGQIEERLEELGMSSPAAAGIAAHSTRDKKQVMSHEETLAAHKRMADQFGNQAEKVVAGAARRQEVAMSNQPSEIDTETRMAQRGVEYAKEKHFEREAVVDERRVVVDSLRRSMGEARIDAVETEMEKQMAAGELREVWRGTVSISRREADKRDLGEGNTTRYITSKQVIVSEQSVLQAMLTGQNIMEPICTNSGAIGQSKVRDFLNETQQQTIVEVLTTRDKISGLQGLAGTGKTTVLESIREGAEQSGYVVQGFAPTSKAAQQLRDANISADTLQGFLTKGGEADDTKHLYMLDESSLASTVQMRAFVDKLGPDDRVLFVGDTQQHQGVDAGKPFDQMQQAGMKTSVLDKIMRQRDPELLKAVEHLSRPNETGKGVAMLKSQGRIHEISDQVARVEAISELYVKDAHSTIIVSPDNASRREINCAVRQKLQSLDKISRKDHTVKVLINRSDITGAERKWAACYNKGEYVEYQKGSKKYGLDKKSIALVIAADGSANTLTVQKKDGTQVTYSPLYVSGVNVYREEALQVSVGDRLQFTAPDKKLKVANRDIGTIESITKDAKSIAVKMDSGRSVTFNTDEMRTIDHGYAVTSHSSQGLTANKVIVNMDTEVHPDLINTRFAYVSVSRARDDAQIFTNDVKKLTTNLTNDVTKESAIDARQYAEELSRAKQPVPSNKMDQAGHDNTPSMQESAPNKSQAPVAEEHSGSANDIAKRQEEEVNENTIGKNSIDNTNDPVDGSSVTPSNAINHKDGGSDLTNTLDVSNDLEWDME
jgi:conjugative relaxase-like TrwC/TraI family protein